ncbi:hypothetical protein BV898_13750 [Hypsibius exemplaris]|uniref:Tc1-like transposase DDE domain-containing protein n=1 Tax=Hypsibius exemplaris TaxID=2072580 RepID=A0A1W0W9S4_HYPEX|nr:hypothetical protein BV898_13750 [Hypsibius exemplaris]
MDGRNAFCDGFYCPNKPENRKKPAPVKVGKPSWPKQRMTAMGYSWRGQTPLYVVDSKVKVNAALFIEQILKPMMTVDVPALYGKEADKVVLHMDSAPAHVAAPVNKWLTDHGYKFIQKEDWLANSPDLAPMDFFANGYFKNRLRRRKYRTEAGMIKCAGEEWTKIPLEMLQKSLLSWPDRIWAVHKAKGHVVPKKAKRLNKK